MRTRDRVALLAATGEYETMQAIGDVVGVTRERVRQIVRSENIPWHDYFVRLEWECAGCGKAISVARSQWQSHWRYMPAHCRECSQRDQAEFCKRGHLRTDHTGAVNAKYGSSKCLACERIRARCVTERRPCLGCGRKLAITRGMASQIKYGNATGNRCHSCHIDWVNEEKRGWL